MSLLSNQLTFKMGLFEYQLLVLGFHVASYYGTAVYGWEDDS